MMLRRAAMKVLGALALLVGIGRGGRGEAPAR